MCTLGAARKHSAPQASHTPSLVEPAAPFVWLQEKKLGCKKRVCYRAPAKGMRINQLVCQVHSCGLSPLRTPSPSRPTPATASLCLRGGGADHRLFPRLLGASDSDETRPGVFLEGCFRGPNTRVASTPWGFGWGIGYLGRAEVVGWRLGLISGALAVAGCGAAHAELAGHEPCLVPGACCCRGRFRSPGAGGGGLCGATRNSNSSLQHLEGFPELLLVVFLQSTM